MYPAIPAVAIQFGILIPAKLNPVAIFHIGDIAPGRLTHLLPLLFRHA